MEYFLNNTIEPNLFKISDVPYDNACFYSAISKYVHFAVPHEHIRNLKRFSKWGKSKDIEKMDDYFKNNENVEYLARYLQMKILNFVKENPNEIIPELGLSIKNAIPIIHEITFDEYLTHYDIFAADDYLNEEIYNENGFLVDRWGSIIEQFAISKIIGCSVVIFNSQKFNTRYNKPVNGKIINNKPEKGVRLRPFQIINREMLSKKMPIFLIWREYKKNGHYLVALPKNIDLVLKILDNK